MNNELRSQLLSNSLSRTKNYFLLFLLWPFLAFFTALFNYKRRDARKVVYLFLIYYGLSFVIGELGGDGPDAERSALRLIYNSQLPFSDIFALTGGLYSSDTSMDIIEPLISFIVSRFTSEYSILFAVYAAIYGFFYLKSINLLHDRYVKNPGWNAMIFMVFFIMVIPITAINGFRMYAAAWIFFYGAYHVILHHDARYIFIALASSLVHWSFLSANAVLIIYFFAGNRNFIYLPLALISFVLPQLMLPVFKSISLRLGGGIQSRYEGYSSENYILGIQGSYENASWFLTLSTDLVFYYLLLAMVVIQFKSRNLEKDKAETNLFSFLLLFLAFVNFGKPIASFGSRFQTIFYLFATLYVFTYYVKLSGNKIGIFTLIGLFPMLLNIAVTFRIGSESINAWLFTPGFGLPLVVPALSIADFLF